MLIYLAGAITCYYKEGKLKTAQEWRQKATDFFKDRGHSVFDPTINFQYNSIYPASEMVRQNDFYLDKADIILVNIDDLDKSYGTIYEIITARCLNKPVVGFGSNKITSHPHISACITSSNFDLDMALDYISSVYHC